MKRRIALIALGAGLTALAQILPTGHIGGAMRGAGCALMGFQTGMLFIDWRNRRKDGAA